VCAVHYAEVVVEVGHCLLDAELAMVVRIALIVAAGLLHTGDGELRCRLRRSSQPIEISSFLKLNGIFED